MFKINIVKTLSLLVMVNAACAEFTGSKKTNIVVVPSKAFDEKMPEHVWSSTNSFDGRHKPAEVWGYKKRWGKIKINIDKVTKAKKGKIKHKKYCHIRLKRKSCDRKVTVVQIHGKRGDKCNAKIHCVSNNDLNNWLINNSYRERYTGPKTNYNQTKLAGRLGSIDRLKKIEESSNYWESRGKAYEEKMKKFQKKLEKEQNNISNKFMRDLSNSESGLMLVVRQNADKLSTLMNEGYDLVAEGRVLLRGVEKFLQQTQYDIKRSKSLLKKFKFIKKVKGLLKDLDAGDKEVNSKLNDIKDKRKSLADAENGLKGFKKVLDNKIEGLMEIESFIQKTSPKNSLIGKLDKDKKFRGKFFKKLSDAKFKEGDIMQFIEDSDIIDSLGDDDFALLEKL